MGYSVTTPPTSEPITLAEAKEHLNVDFTEDDTLIGAMITAARTAVENYLDYKLITQTLTEYWDEFPTSGVFNLRFWPVQSVTSIGYTDSDGTAQTWSSANYQTDLVSEPARIKTAYSVSYPTTRADELNAVNVVYVAGYGGPDSVPELIKRAILLIIADLYDNRTNAAHTMQTKWQHLLNVGGYKRVL